MMEPKEAIRGIYTETFPVGPAVAGDPFDMETLSLLFDKDNKLVSQLDHEKALIIGRKGSGKTTLLASAKLMDPKAHTFYLQPEDLFSQIVKEVDSLSEGVVYVEQISRIWDFVLWGVVFNYVASRFNEDQLRKYCQSLSIEEDMNPYEAIVAMLSQVREFPPSDWPIPEKIVYKKIGDLSFLQAKQIAVDVLIRNKARVFLLMDSLEDFKLELPNYASAVAGLLRCLGDFNEKRANPAVLRCCLPAEKYFDYSNLSTNPLKDFRNGLLLHWKAGELIHLSAIRYARFLREYYPDVYRGHVRQLNLDKRDHLEKFWGIIFPGMVVSRLGKEEKPMAYILRHTQLLPRHFIVYLNEIIGRSLKEEGKAHGISNGFVRDGIAAKEELIKDQILQAYASPLKDAQRLCMEALKELNTMFTWSDFDIVASKVSKMGIPGASDRTEIMSLLTEVGAVGRVVGESDRYIEGIFEYMVPHKLVFSERDRFCIHPVFSEVYNVNIEYSGVKAVYTFWSGITDNDLEHWM